MEMNRTIEVGASRARLWAILADDYDQVGDWARAVQMSAPNVDAKPVNGSHEGGWVCKSAVGDVEETLTLFDPESASLGYVAKAKAMPFFVRSLTGRWQLASLRDGTDVHLGFTADLMFPFSFLMGWAIKRQFLRVIDETLKDLKIYVETGQVHPEKMSAATA
ncbi:MAG: SRPBCC family protein [Pseudomonadota bacterium]